MLGWRARPGLLPAPAVTDMVECAVPRSERSVDPPPEDAACTSRGVSRVLDGAPPLETWLPELLGRSSLRCRKWCVFVFVSGLGLPV
jgi:hypothetical protein